MSILKPLILAGVIVSAIASLQAQDKTTLDSLIESVIVYPDSAQVTRSAEVSIRIGQNLLVIPYLPSELNANSLKSSLQGGDHSMLIRDMSLKWDDVGLNDYPDLKALVSRGEVMEAELAEVKDRYLMVQKRIEYAKEIATSFTEGFGKKEGKLPSAEEIDATWAFFEKTYMQSQAKLKALRDEMKPLNKAYNVNLQAIQKLKLSLQKLKAIVEIQIESTVAKNVKIELSYLIRSSGWQPVYELRAYPQKDSVSIRYKASIYQNSGENWNDVELTLSTAHASSWADVPNLYPIRLNKVEPMPMVGIERVMKVQSLSYDAMPAPAGASMDMRELEHSVVVNSSFSSYSVDLPRKFSIDSGKDQKKVLIREMECVGEFWTEIVPSKDNKGHLIAEVSNDFDLPILAGDAILFVEDQMVGQSNLRNTLIAGKIELSLGVNENISVERKTGKQDEADRGVFGKSTRLTRQYFTIVENNGSKSFRIKVKDQFPLSENEKIVVNGISPNSGDVSFEENTGIFTWNFVLEAEQSRKLETHFEVTYPENWSIPTHF